MLSPWQALTCARRDIFKWLEIRKLCKAWIMLPDLHKRLRTAQILSIHAEKSWNLSEETETYQMQISSPINSSPSDAHTQNDLLAHWHTSTWVCSAVLQSRLATAKLLWGLVLGTANFQTICSSWLETDNLTAQLSCSAWGHSLALLESLV